jgi:hypothetical protein
MKKGDKTDCNNCRGISLLPTAYKILSNIFFFARLTPYVNEIIGEHQCEFRCNRSTMDQIFYIQQILKKKWEYNGTVHQLQTSKKLMTQLREKFFTVFCLNLVCLRS